ncbi:hypothetical protein EV122DRAFT_256628 [Schizophyllum commune]
MKTRDIVCQVLVAGLSVEEYGLRISKGRTRSTCWIASETSKTFAVRVSDPRRKARAGCDLDIDLTVDGRLCYQGVLLEDDETDELTIFGPLCSASKARAFIFDPIQPENTVTTISPLLGCPGISEVPGGSRIEKDHDRPGDISVRVWRSRVPSAANPDPNVPPSPALKIPFLAETESKGLSHEVRFGGGCVSIEEQRVVDSKRLEEKVTASFTFRYRSKDVLFAKRIISPTTNSHHRVLQSPPSALLPKRRIMWLDNTIMAKRKLTPGDRSPAKRETIIDVDAIVRAEEVVRQAEGRAGAVKLETISAFLPGERIDLTQD